MILVIIQWEIVYLTKISIEKFNSDAGSMDK